MKCPKCSHKVMSFTKSLVLFDPRRINCQECEAELQLSRKWISAFWVNAAAAFLIGAIYGLMHYPIVGGNTMIFLIVWIVSASSYSLIFWKKATYELMPISEAVT